jgi:hypothetical protein
MIREYPSDHRPLLLVGAGEERTSFSHVPKHTTE